MDRETVPSINHPVSEIILTQIILRSTFVKYDEKITFLTNISLGDCNPGSLFSISRSGIDESIIPGL